MKRLPPGFGKDQPPKYIVYETIDCPNARVSGPPRGPVVELTPGDGVLIPVGADESAVLTPKLPSNLPQ